MLCHRDHRKVDQNKRAPCRAEIRETFPKIGQIVEKFSLPEMLSVHVGRRVLPCNRVVIFEIKSRRQRVVTSMDLDDLQS